MTVTSTTASTAGTASRSQAGYSWPRGLRDAGTRSTTMTTAKASRWR